MDGLLILLNRYDTMCLDDPNSIIIRTDGVNKISNLVMTGDVGTVDVEAGKTRYTIFFFFLSDRHRYNIFAIVSNLLDISRLSRN